MDPVAFARFLGLDAILEGQDGVVRRDQAVAAGVDRATIDNSIRRGRWIRLFPRVYLTTRKAPTTRARIRACWLWAGDHSVIAGSAAAWWLGLNPAVPRTISVVIPPSTKRNPQPDVQVIRGIVDPRDADFEDWIKVTRASRTCLDLARRQEPDHLETALRLRKIDPARLEQSLDRGRGRRGQLRARIAVGEVSDNPWAPSERLFHGLLRQAGITGWVANAPVVLRSGVRYPDVAIEDIKLAIEVDGREHHTREIDFENDRVRNNQFVEAGWTVLHFTWRQLTQEPDAMITSIRATIARLRPP